MNHHAQALQNLPPQLVLAILTNPAMQNAVDSIKKHPEKKQSKNYGKKRDTSQKIVKNPKKHVYNIQR